MGIDFSEHTCIGDSLLQNSTKFPEKHAFVFLEGNEVVTISNRQLFETVENYSKVLYAKFPKNSRLLLLYADTYDFICAFLAANLSGLIPIPMYPPRNNCKDERLAAILEDCKPSAILTSNEFIKKFNKFIAQDSYKIELLDLSNFEVPETKNHAFVKSDDLAFIQYTSGSTSKPKGVMISHENLHSNLESMQKSYGIDASSILCSWLPFYHDMGLVGKLLQSLFSGCTLVSIRMNDFVRKPSVWLKAISDYSVTHSAAPNFAYDHCHEKIDLDSLDAIDLSSWKVAVNGSETIKLSTLEKFANKFSSIGFKKMAFIPSYGLAESTLFVSGGNNFDSDISTIDSDDFETSNSYKPSKVVSSGKIADSVIVKIRDRNSGKLVGDNVEGEILISSPSIMRGYWNKNSELGFTTLDDSGSLNFLETGDLGITQNNELFVTGRIKELLIIRGKNYLPYDIEDRISIEENRIVQNGVSACCITSNGQEELVIVAEIHRANFNQEEGKEICLSIVKIVREYFSLEVHETLLVPVMGLPRTSSGKIQRFLVTQKYRNEEFINSFSSAQLLNELLHENKEAAPVVVDFYDDDYIKNYVVQVLTDKFKIDSKELNDLSAIGLVNIGLDSIKSIELMDQLKNDLKIDVEIEALIECGSIQELIECLELNKLLGTPESSESDEEMLL